MSDFETENNRWLQKLVIDSQ